MSDRGIFREEIDKVLGEHLDNSYDEVAGKIKDLIDGLEARVNDVKDLLEIDSVFDIGDIKDAYEKVDTLAGYLY